MNTPPAIIPDLAQMELDPSWAIFDETSDRLATDSFFRQLTTEQNINLRPRDVHSVTDNALGSHDTQNFEHDKIWGGHGNVAWPSNLLRLFGTAEYQPSNNETINLS